MRRPSSTYMPTGAQPVNGRSRNIAQPASYTARRASTGPRSPVRSQRAVFSEWSLKPIAKPTIRPATANNAHTACRRRSHQTESENDSGDGERDPNGACHGGKHGQGQSQPQQTANDFALLERERNDQNPKDVQRNAVGHRLEKWAARAIGMKAEALVKNEARKDERARIDEEGNGNEDEVSESNDDKDFEMSSLRCASENQHSKMKQRKGNDVFAGDNAPHLCVEWLPK